MFQIVQDDVAVDGLFLQLQVQQGDGYFAEQRHVEFLVVGRGVGFSTVDSVALRCQFREQTYGSTIKTILS